MENSLKQDTETKTPRSFTAIAGRSTEQELEVLYQISASISSHLELDEVLNQIIGLVHQVTRGDACFLYLLDASNQELVSAITGAANNSVSRRAGRRQAERGQSQQGLQP